MKTLPQTRLALLLATLLTSLFLLATPGAQAYPEPEIVPRAWELEFEHKEPRLVSVQTPEGEIEWYWYVVYKVTNDTESERLYIPEVTIATDAGHLIPASRNVPASVFELIKHKERNPLLESPVHVIGRLLLGENHAKESAIIWPAVSKDVNEVRVFIAGLSGETKVVQSPINDEEKVFRKTLMLRYTAEGNPKLTANRQLNFRSQQWIMR